MEAVFGKKQYLVTIDSGAIASIIRKDLVRNHWLHSTSNCNLRTTTEERAKVYGEVRLNIQLAGATHVPVWFLGGFHEGTSSKLNFADQVLNCDDDL